MKKILKNKKGFTLVELLAVIVVLAIIMVIATQRIGNVIKQNTASSFKSSLDMVVKSAKQADMLAEGTLLISDITKLVDYDTNQFTIKISDIDINGDGNVNAEDEKYICIVSGSGKFNNMDNNLFDDVGLVSTSGYYADKSGTTTTACKKFR